MKKNFIEPELVRIDLKMTENIAASGGEMKEAMFPLWGFDDAFSIYSTLQYENEGIPCRTYLAHTGVYYTPGTSVEEAREFIRNNTSIWSCI